MADWMLKKLCCKSLHMKFCDQNSSSSSKTTESSSSMSRKLTLLILLFTLILLPLALTVFTVIPTEWLRVVLRHGVDHNESDAQVSVMRQWKQTLFCASSAPQDSKHLKPMLFSVAGVWPKSELKSSQDTSTSVAATRSVNRKEISSETQASLNLAKEMTSQGKTERALKIFLHALALYPRHPDVLNEYGEFLEKNKRDIVTAEHMYCKALVASPTHTKALENRHRTLPLVEEIDQNQFNQIDKKRDVLVRVPEGHPGLRRMVSENYFRHIYHTTALEGNTFTLSQTRSFVETRIVISGKSIMEHNEILGMEAALHFLNSSLIKRIGAITIEDIKGIHRRVLGYVDPIGSGIFRTTQVFVGDFIPPEANQVERLVEDFVDWLNSDDALSLHPIETAALAHYKLVYIHPFYDGNGRTSRLLMNLVLMQTGYPPIIIPVEKKQEYYEHLQTANEGDVRPFIRFIARCTERTLDEYLWASVENVNRTFPELSLRNSDMGRTILPRDEL